MRVLYNNSVSSVVGLFKYASKDTATGNPSCLHPLASKQLFEELWQLSCNIQFTFVIYKVFLNWISETLNNKCDVLFLVYVCS